MLRNFQEKRLAKEIDSIEKDTGFKLRVLAQNYPDTPGTTVVRGGNFMNGSIWLRVERAKTKKTLAKN